MLIPPPPKDEAQRLRELHSLDILDTEAESLFDDLVKLGSHIAQCPISAITLIDHDRQWFKARVGFEFRQVPRDISFCTHSIHGVEPFIVENAQQDVRFADNPAVTGETHFRFYAGIPLITSAGYCIGTLCAIDREPKKLSQSQIELLQCLARQASFLIEQRKNRRILEMTRRNSQSLFEKSPYIIASMQGPNHIIEYINKKDVRLLGNADALGKSIADTHPDAMKTGFRKVLDTVYHCGQTLTLEDTTFIVSDEARHFNLVLTPRFGSDGKIDGVVGIIDDVTERKNLEIELKALNDLSLIHI